MVTSFRAGLRAYLQNQLGSLVGGRIHPTRLPDKAIFPAIVYQVITNAGRFAHDAPIPLRNPRIQFDVWALKASECETIASALEQALLGYRGPMGDVEYTAAWELITSEDSYEPDTKLERISLDFRGWYGT